MFVYDHDQTWVLGSDNTLFSVDVHLPLSQNQYPGGPHLGNPFSPLLFDIKPLSAYLLMTPDLAGVNIQYTRACIKGAPYPLPIQHSHQTSI